MTRSKRPRHRVVIIGGGFGGLYAAKSLRGAPFEITLIDKRNFHLFQPLLYQVATGGLSPANIAAPLRSVLKRQRNTTTLLAEATGIDAKNKQVRLRRGRQPYDSLIVAAGMVNHYFGNDHWQKHAPGLKTLEDATSMRRRILSAFEQAEREDEPVARGAWLTFVVIGGGPTGVELAGALAEIARHTLRDEFRRIDPADAQILLLEGTERVLPPFHRDLSAKAAGSLRRLGVTVRPGAIVTDIQADHLIVRSGGAEERIEARTVLWGAGVSASPLGRAIADATGAALDEAGRVIVQSDCSVPEFPDLFVIGDLARCPARDGSTLPGIAPVAMQQGRYVATLIKQRQSGLKMRPFDYDDRGIMATIGRAAAVADIRGWRFSGYLAWLVWLFVHILFLIEFQNRVLVMMQWAWNYVTWNRSARLITQTQVPSARKKRAGRT